MAAETRATVANMIKVLADLPASTPRISEVGRVIEVGDGIAIVAGLRRALADEVLDFASGVQGIVLDLEPGRLGVALLGPSERVTVGEDVWRTRRVVGTPVGPGLLGRVVDPTGQPIDGQGPVEATAKRSVEADAPQILARAPVSRPLATGVTAIDAAVPIGRGQRQLVIGDRQTGKTSIAVDTILNQADTGILCIYCAIGQRGDAVAKAVEAIRKGAMLGHTAVVVAGDEDAPGLSYIAPYAAMAMAEYFADQGSDVLVVLDDLTHHARSYRELSLLLRRPPGREAFPGDIFYVHARLLERAGQFAEGRDNGSITVLPVVETQAENLSAYIPTNLISITDGQIYLSPRLVQKNQFPAVDLGVSVSRVGGKAQHRAFGDVAGNLRVTLSQFEELEEFARFGTRLDAATRARLERGAAMRAALRQPERDPIPAAEQLAILLAAGQGLFDGLDDAQGTAARAALRDAIRQDPGDLPRMIAANAPLDDEERTRILDMARRVLPTVEADHAGND